jgi:hypothetical protein
MTATTKPPARPATSSTSPSTTPTLADLVRDHLAATEAAERARLGEEVSRAMHGAGLKYARFNDYLIIDCSVHPKPITAVIRVGGVERIDHDFRPPSTWQAEIVPLPDVEVL